MDCIAPTEMLQGHGVLCASSSSRNSRTAPVPASQAMAQWRVCLALGWPEPQAATRRPSSETATLPTSQPMRLAPRGCAQMSRGGLGVCEGVAGADALEGASSTEGGGLGKLNSEGSSRQGQLVLLQAPLVVIPRPHRTGWT